MVLTLFLPPNMVSQLLLRPKNLENLQTDFSGIIYFPDLANKQNFFFPNMYVSLPIWFLSFSLIQIPTRNAANSILNTLLIETLTREEISGEVGTRWNGKLVRKFFATVWFLYLPRQTKLRRCTVQAVKKVDICACFGTFLPFVLGRHKISSRLSYN